MRIILMGVASAMIAGTAAAAPTSEPARDTVSSKKPFLWDGLTVREEAPAAPKVFFPAEVFRAADRQGGKATPTDKGAAPQKPAERR